MTINRDLQDIVVCYGWVSPNRGDQAITLGIDRILSEIEGVEPKILPYSPIDDNIKGKVEFVESPIDSWTGYLREKYERFPLKDMFFALEVSSFLAAPQRYLRTLPGDIAREFKVLIDADLILYNAGHLFLSPENVSNYDILRNDLKTVLPGLLARRLEIPYGLWGQSVGPFEGDPTFVDTMVLNGADFIYCRESESVQTLQSMDIDANRTMVVPDPAFALPYDESTVEDPLGSYDIDGKYICLTVRRSGARRGVTIPDEVYYHYLDTLAEFIDRWYAETSIDIVFISQHGAKPGYSDLKLADDNVAKELRGRLDDPTALTIVNEDFSIDELKYVYAAAEGLIGTRFHALIFALQVGTPVIGLSSYYTGPKIDGLMKDLEREDDLFHMETLDADDLYSATETFREQTSGRVHPLVEEYSEGGREDLERILRGLSG